MLGSNLRRRRATLLGCTVGLLVTSLVVWERADDGGAEHDGGRRDQAAGPDTTRPERLRARLATPPDATTLVPGAAAADLAVAASEAVFETAPVVVLAPERDVDAQARAASAAVALGVPLLLAPAPSESGPGGAPRDARGDAPPDARDVRHVAVADELARLSPRAALAFGQAAADWSWRHGEGVPVVRAPDEAEALRRVEALDVGEQLVVEPGRLASSVATLRRERPALLSLEAAPTAPTTGGPPDTADGASDADDTSDADDAGRAPAVDEVLPAVELPDPLDDVLVLVPSDGAGVAAAATARAGGARVVPIAGTDPRADPGALAALAEQPIPEWVVALGDGFGPADRLRRRLAVATTGVELPGGGQVLFPGRRMIALYGHPGAPALGVLGEQPVDAAVARAQQLAASYEGLVPEAVVPAFEIITTVASASPGPDGNYSSESQVADLRPWIDAAGRAGVYVVLDLQPGRTDFLTQARRYEELLAEPHVGLALDPEWRLGPDQRHLAQIGSVGVDEVNAVAAWLAELTRQRHLPQKLLLLHQFQPRMIAGRARLDTGHDELAVLIHADGFGTPGQKFDTWNNLRREPLADAWWGWKNFIDEDQPTFAPEQTVAVDPTPWFVSYQ